uniref:putative ubiquitin-like-specific protease 1B n=1 Tax=Erigeron canadensis TaxID=72917 RepID=UPI001CB923A4|nr:putative ubiquitin-like-specific protease 1B [Erigeron canadensis]
MDLKNRDGLKHVVKLIESDGYDFKLVKNWTPRLECGLQEYDKVFVPVYKISHWCLAVINNKDKKFQYFDSLGGSDSQVMKVLAKYIVDEVAAKKNQRIDVSDWEREFVKNIPKQENSYDCGVFIMKYADFYSRKSDHLFGQKDMPYFRRRMALEILRLNASE